MRQFIIFVPVLIAIGAASYIQFPQAEISNGIIQIRFYLPDPDKGYYRGTRFDWSGVTPKIEYKGHTYCGQWFESYNPTTHDAIMGPVEAFSPLGYENLSGSRTFVVIGVGVLLKKENQAYSPFLYHSILNPGVWKSDVKKDRIEFSQKLTDTGYSYDYKKTCLLEKDKPELVLIHYLKNTGNKSIETDVYNHNLFLIDQEKTGAQFEVNFPFDLIKINESPGFNEFAEIQGKNIRIKHPFLNTEHIYTELEGFNTSSQDYQIAIENHKTGAAVKIFADKPLSKLAFWACSTTLTPEPYIHLKINPGDSVSWRIRYQFYTCHIQP